jgi:DNA-binding response OmpR family regulator
MADHPRGTVLVIEDDPVLRFLIKEILTDEGFAVALADRADPDLIGAAVDHHPPDCILLDGESSLGYGTSWVEAAQIAAGNPVVPVIMFTGHANAVREATERTSARSRAAAFAGVVPKPCDPDQLVATVARAIRGTTDWACVGCAVPARTTG